MTEPRAASFLDVVGSTRIAVDVGIATSVGIDEETLTIWVSTCAVDCDDF